MNNSEKNNKYYKKLLLKTNLTGAYNIYLEKYKKAYLMGIIFTISTLLIAISKIYFFIDIHTSLPIDELSSFLMLGKSGLFINFILWILDYSSKLKDVENYNNSIDEISKLKEVSIYKKFLLIFGILGLDNLYLDKELSKTYPFMMTSILAPFEKIIFILSSFLYIIVFAITRNPLIANSLSTVCAYIVLILLILPLPISILNIFLSIPKYKEAQEIIYEYNKDLH